MSYKVADALALVDHPVVHVSAVLPAYAGAIKGNCLAPDDKIAEWCAKTEHVLISADQEFNGRWVRTGVLAKHGAEVLVFDRELTGLQEQHYRITALLPIWLEVLGRQSYGHRVWVQTSKREPHLVVGKALRPRSRPPIKTAILANTRVG